MADNETKKYYKKSCKECIEGKVHMTCKQKVGTYKTFKHEGEAMIKLVEDYFYSVIRPF